MADQDDDNHPNRRPSKPAARMLGFSLGSRFNHTREASNSRHRPSPLARMMIEAAQRALLEGDYAESLEDLMTIKSIEEHSDIDAAIAITSLRVIEALELDERAYVIRPQLVAYLTARRDEPSQWRKDDLGILQRVFHHKRLIELRNEANRVQSGILSSEGDGGASELVNDLVEQSFFKRNMAFKGYPKRELRDLSLASREVASEMRRLRKVLSEENRVRQDLVIATTLLQHALEKASATDQHVLLSLASAQSTANTSSAKLDHLLQESRFARTTTFAVLAAIAVLILLSILSRGLFSS